MPRPSTLWQATIAKLIYRRRRKRIANRILTMPPPGETPAGMVDGLKMRLPHKACERPPAAAPRPVWGGGEISGQGLRPLD